MIKIFKKIWIFLLPLFVFWNCTRQPKHAYFGGKIENPGGPYVYLFHDYLPFATDSFRLDHHQKFGGYIHIDSPTTFIMLSGNDVHDIYIRPGDSLMLAANGDDFDNTLNFSGSEVAAFNNLIRDIGNTGEEEMLNIIPLLSQYNAGVIKNFINLYKDRKTQSLKEFKLIHPQWKFTPKEKIILDILYHTPDLFLYEKFNEVNRGKDTIHYEIPFPFSFRKQYPVSFFLHFWLTQYLLNRYPDVNFNHPDEAKWFLQQVDSIFADPILSDLEKYKVIQHKIGDLYPHIDTSAIRELSLYLDSIFIDPKHAAFTRNYINLFLRGTEGNIPMNVSLMHASNCDTLSLYQLIEDTPDPYVVIFPIRHFDDCYLNMYHEMDSLQPAYNGQVAFYYLYNKQPPALNKNIYQLNPEPFYRLSPASNFFGLYNTIYFRKPIVYVFNKKKEIIKILDPCREDLKKTMDSILIHKF